MVCGLSMVQLQNPQRLEPGALAAGDFLGDGDIERPPRGLLPPRVILTSALVMGTSAVRSFESLSTAFSSLPELSMPKRVEKGPDFIDAVFFVGFLIVSLFWFVSS